MFRNLLRTRLPIRGTPRYYRFQIYRESKLFDKKLERNDWEWEDGVEVSNDGLVHPKINLDVSNGALFMPNTHLMQEVTRGSFDNYLDAVDDGQPTANPHYLCMPKGNAIPSSLVLYRERDSRFTLQPSHPLLLAVLNEILTEFYTKSGVVIPPEEWLERNPYHEAYFDDSEEWMGQ